MGACNCNEFNNEEIRDLRISIYTLKIINICQDNIKREAANGNIESTIEYCLEDGLYATVGGILRKRGYNTTINKDSITVSWYDAGRHISKGDPNDFTAHDAYVSSISVHKNKIRHSLERNGYYTWNLRTFKNKIYTQYIEDVIQEYSSPLYNIEYGETISDGRDRTHIDNKVIINCIIIKRVPGLL